MQNLFWGASRQGTHGKIIILMLPDGKLHLEILEGKEFMKSIKQLFMESLKQNLSDIENQIFLSERK